MEKTTDRDRRALSLSGILLLAFSLVFVFTPVVRAYTYAVTTLDLDPGKVLGASPQLVGLNTATNKLYVVSDNGVVSIFNTLTNAFITSFTAGNQNDLVVDSAANKVYLTNGANMLTVIDGATDTVAAWIPVGTNPKRIAMHPNGRVYVTNYGATGNPGNNTVSVINASTNTVEATVPVGKNPVGIGINGNDVYIANEGSGNASVIDANPSNGSFNTVVATVTISGATTDWGPAEVQVYGGTIYILNEGHTDADVQSSFAVIDGATRALADLGTGVRNPVLIPGTYYSDGFAFRPDVNAVVVRNYEDINGNELHTYRAWYAATKSWGGTGPVEDIGGPITAWVRNETLKRLYLLAGGNIHVVNVDTTDTTNYNHVVATLPFWFDSENRRALRLDEAAGLLYAAGGEMGGRAEVFYLSDNSHKHTYYTGGGPEMLSVDSTRNKVWVGHNGGGLGGNLGVRKIDGATRAVSGLDTGAWVGFGAILNEATNRVYAVDLTSGSFGLTPINGATGAIAPIIPLAINGIDSYALNETTGRLYFLSTAATLKVVNVDPGSGSFHSVEAPVGIGGYAEGVAVNEADNWVYVGNNDGYVSCVNGATNTVDKTIPVAQSSDQIAINQSTKLAYVSSDDTSSPAVRVIDVNPAHAATFNTVISIIPIAAKSEYIAVNETTNRIYVDIDGNGTIGVIDGATHAVESIIPVPGSSGGKMFAIDESLGRIYAMEPENNKVHVLDGNPGSPSFNTILQSIDVGWWPNSIAVNKSTHDVFTANAGNNTVSVITPLLNFWSNSVDVGGGWHWLSFFGYYNAAYAPWVYHAQHGWLYAYDDGNSGAHLWYHDMQRFVWTNRDVYPFLYRFGANETWLWYLMGSANPRWFYNLNAGNWESLP